MRSKGIIFFDIDGTLIDCPKELFNPTLKTVESLKKLKENGYKIGIATGRPKSFISKNILDINFDAIISSNGAYAEVDKKAIYNNFLDNEKVKEFIELCRKNKVSFILEGQDISLYEEVNKNEVENFFEEFFIPKDNLKKIREFKDSINVNKLVVFLENEDKYNVFYNKYSDEFNFMVHPNNLSYDMYINNFSKAVGVKKVYENLDISKENTYAFGDGINDIEMIDEVGKGIAMGKENAELIKHAFMSTKPAIEDGISIALEALKLI